jgi:DNA-binding NarL/FixJ family response regulator
MNDLFAGSTRKCPTCGKSFSFTCREDEWGYAYENRLMCSYSCMRAWERRMGGYKYLPIGMSCEERNERNRRIVQLFESGKSKSYIAREMDVSHDTVCSVLQMHGLTTKAIRARRDARIMELYRRGAQISAIGNELGISYTTVAHVIQRKLREVVTA